MGTHKVAVSAAELDKALRQARSLEAEPVARTVEHVASCNVLIVGLSNGRRLALPVEDLQGLGRATPEELANYELLGGGTGISFPALNVDLYVPALIEGVWGNRKWMAELGRKGGSSRSAAKGNAARANGARGGRPRKAA